MKRKIRKLWFKVAGTNTPERQEGVKYAQETVTCVRESPGVFRVEGYTGRGKEIFGYMPSDLAAQIDPVFEGRELCGRLVKRVGGWNWGFESHYKYAVPYGLLIEIVVPEYADSAGVNLCLTPETK